MTYSAKNLCALLLIMLLSGCYFLQPTSVPIEQIIMPANKEEQGTDLMILLPGMGDYPQSYVSRGFIASLQQQRSGFDVIALNTHFGYYRSRTLLDRVQQDVILPAQQKGYRRIHIGGISMGGYGSLLLDREFPGTFTTVTLLAPYLGEEDAYDNYKNTTPVDYNTLDEGNLWPWLYGMNDTERKRIFLAYGEQDSLAEIDSKLAVLLPSENTLTMAGDHKWTTWMPLWERLLKKIDYLRY